MARINSILKFKGNEPELKKLHDEVNETATQLESSFTHNIYEFSYPSIAKAIHILESVDDTDKTMDFYADMMMFVNKVYIFDKSDDSYVLYSEKDRDENDEDIGIQSVGRVLQEIPDEDAKLITKYIQSLLYTPKFVLKTTCSLCGTHMENPLTTENLLFLKARNMIETTL
jgi:hypothetical protein